MLNKFAAVAASLASVGFAGTPEVAVNAITKKAIEIAVQNALAERTPPGECAIPLRESKGGDGRIVDPMAKTTAEMGFDKIAKPAKIQACHFERPAGK